MVLDDRAIFTVRAPKKILLLPYSGYKIDDFLGCLLVLIGVNGKFKAGPRDY